MRLSARFNGYQSSTAAQGIANILIAVALFAVMDAIVKWLSVHYPIAQLVFFRSFLAFVPLSILIVRDGGWHSLRTSRPGGHMLRSLIGLASMTLFFWAFAVLPLADAVAISFSGPLFLTLLSIPLLGERVGPRRWLAVLAGFAGVLLIVRPGSGLFGLTALIPVGAALGFALAMICVRRLSITESNTAIVFYFTLTCTAVSGLALPFEWVKPAPEHWLPLIAIGLIGGTAQLFMTQAFRLAPASTVAPFEYTAIVFALLFGVLIWNEIPDAWMLIGTAVVIASGLYILHRELLRKGAPTYPTAVARAAVAGSQPADD